MRPPSFVGENRHQVSFVLLVFVSVVLMFSVVLSLYRQAGIEDEIVTIRLLVNELIGDTIPEYSDAFSSRTAFPLLIISDSFLFHKRVTIMIGIALIISFCGSIYCSITRSSEGMDQAPPLLTMWALISALMVFSFFLSPTWPDHKKTNLDCIDSELSSLELYFPESGRKPDGILPKMATDIYLKIIASSLQIVDLVSLAFCICLFGLLLELLGGWKTKAKEKQGTG